MLGASIGQTFLVFSHSRFPLHLSESLIPLEYPPFTPSFSSSRFHSTTLLRTKNGDVIPSKHTYPLFWTKKKVIFTVFYRFFWWNLFPNIRGNNYYRYNLKTAEGKFHFIAHDRHMRPIMLLRLMGITSQGKKSFRKNVLGILESISTPVSFTKQKIMVFNIYSRDDKPETCRMI